MRSFEYLRRALEELLERNKEKKVFVTKEAGKKWQIFSLDSLGNVIEEKNTAREAVEAILEKYKQYANDDRPEFVWIVFEGFFEQFKQCISSKEILDESVNLSKAGGFRAFAESENPYSFFELKGFRGKASNFEEAIEKIKTAEKGIICFNVNVKD